MKSKLITTAIILLLISAGTVSAKVYLPVGDQQLSVTPQLLLNNSISRHLIRSETKYWEF
ncbi:MAG: hypothetical protein OFPI_15730 [Osedax symbiont Rs2]|nr:MAG: hypothetical protein OFPI_15730 [Osedax symbiont Rs2]